MVFFLRGWHEGAQEAGARGVAPKGENLNPKGKGLDPARVSLKGFYVTGAVATVAGILVVVILNLVTPFDFMVERLTGLFEKDAFHLGLELARRGLGLVAVLTVSCGLFLLVVRAILQPISRCLNQLRAGEAVGPEGMAGARRRLLNLPFMFIPVSLAIWIVVPAFIFLSATLAGILDLRTGVVLSIRASMVGFIASAIGFFGIESYSRRHVIPFFFPRGHLADMKGAARFSISRRIRMLYRLGSLVPLAILIVTLITAQWGVDSTAISAVEYGRRLIFFTLVLAGLFFLTTGILNRMVSRSIAGPLGNMLAVVEDIQKGDYDTRIKVVTNDEIGILGDAGNAMIRGLAEREMIRNAFGQYVTPEIRDEIIAGRIPLEGERKDATVMFADLRNFTPFVENNAPEDVIAGMRAYFTAMHRAIRRHRGLVLQFVGDEIEAVFGVPVPFEDHADAALRAALDMRRALEGLNLERKAQGKVPFSHGIGIHSGRVLAGNTGSDEQSAYALIGDTVNVASRLQGLTKELGCDILVSRETIDRLKGRYSLDGGEARLVKGYSKEIIVYRIPATEEQGLGQ